MYDSFISVSKKFKSSVNLQYDLYNEEKILQYIPTTDLCDVISSYLDSVLQNGKKATFLTGPYGKGKSYLMLMITYLLSRRENKELLEKVKNKISKIDDSLVKKIEELESRKISLLPVIINNNISEDLNHNFLVALRNALSEHGIEDITPVSAYSDALNIINNWERQHSSSFDIFKECQKSLKINLEKIKLGLSNYELDALNKFKSLFQCVNHGYQYNSLVGSDFALIYTDISKRVKEYGYSGLFVIFDEFGVVLEDQASNIVSKLNKIQSFAEKCETSEEDSQMHICCILHKDVMLYGSEKSYFDSFEKIAGRFKQIRFDRSLSENYQLICSAIQKNGNYKQFLNDYIIQNNLSRYYRNNVLYSNKELDYVINNGFPFNPFALYALIQVSEKVAQNERTLFTFISDTDINSFIYFIANNSTGLLNVSIIYDYFEPLLKDNAEYKLLYYKVNSLNKVVIKNTERNIIKCIAVAKIINDNIKYVCNDENIALAMDAPEDEIKKVIESMIKSNILKRNINDNTLDFSVLTDNSFLKLLDDTTLHKDNFNSISKLLNDFNSNKYFVSNKYNFTNKMIRFFRAEYVEASVLKNLNSLDLYINREFCDGIIVNLINDIKLSQKDLEGLLKKWNRMNIIVRYNDSELPQHIIQKLKRMYVAKSLLVSPESLSDDIRNVLPIYINDESAELSTFLEKYNSQAIILSLVNSKEKTLSDYIDCCFTQLYTKTVIINNEQINKNEISAVTNKARINVVDLILNNKKNDYSVTSAEGTILDSFNRSINESYEIIDLIKQWLVANCENSLPLANIVSKLKESPYGMRSGVIPLYVAKSIADLSFVANGSTKTIVLYNADLEIPLNAENLCKALSRPEQYRISLIEINNDRLLMIKKLMSLFSCKDSNSFNDNLNQLLQAIKNAIGNLPPIIIKSSKAENVLHLSDISLDFKEKFLKHDLNTFELLLIQLPQLLNTSIDNVPKVIKDILREYEKELKKLYHEMITATIKSFGLDAKSIKSTYDLWKGQHPEIKNIIFEPQEKMLYKAFESIKFNNEDAMNILSYAIFNCTLNDWNSKKKSDYISILNKFVQRVNSYKGNSLSKKNLNDAQDLEVISQLGKTLYANIVDTMEEYGHSLSNEEKALIIKKILNELIN